ncbi:MAG: hypothetical protein LBJ21_01650 [Acidobacteriota bacterium]|jgi:hypothetical protein|nr:hypothetical protein [Acidobacteriota bacterium]
MRELTFEEVDQIGGGNPVLKELLKWAVAAVADYVWDNKDPYIDTLIRYTAQYGGLYTPIYGQGS